MPKGRGYEKEDYFISLKNWFDIERFGAPRPFSRGEGGPAKPGRKRNGEMVSAGRSPERAHTETFPPAFLFSQQMPLWGHLLTASPRGKRQALMRRCVSNLGFAYRCSRAPAPLHDMFDLCWRFAPLLPGRRWAGEAGSEEERRNVKCRKKPRKSAYRNISARIPLQSSDAPLGPSDDSFPPGEAACAPAPMRFKFRICIPVQQYPGLPSHKRGVYRGHQSCANDF